MSERLCLIEDDPKIGRLIQEGLRDRGYEVGLFPSAEELLGASEGFLQWDLYIVDVLLPGPMSGLDLCRKFRSVSATVPVLILSALSEPSHRIEGLKNGADDYLAKPFEMEELLLRVDGMLKRRSWYGRLPASGAEYQWEGRGIDFQRLEAWAGETRFRLTPKEAMLMKLLVESGGEVVSREEILNRVWGYNVYPSTRTVDNFILRLRKYFEADPGNPKYIHSVRGMGYKFTARKGKE